MQFFVLTLFFISARAIAVVVLYFFCFIADFKNSKSPKLAVYRYGFEPYKTVRYFFDIKVCTIAIIFSFWEFEFVYLKPLAAILTKLILRVWSVVDFLLNLGLNLLHSLCWGINQEYLMILEKMSIVIDNFSIWFNLHCLTFSTFFPVLVAWVFTIKLSNLFENQKSKLKGRVDPNTIETVWSAIATAAVTVAGSLLLYGLYCLDENPTPEITLKIFGPDWCWSYEFSDFDFCTAPANFRFSSYMLSSEVLPNNPKYLIRNFETHRRLILPTNTNIRLLIPAMDVLYSQTVPPFDFKVVVCPGRPDPADPFFQRLMALAGQFNEISGEEIIKSNYYGFMPVTALALASPQYYYMTLKRLKEKSKKQ